MQMPNNFIGLAIYDLNSTVMSGMDLQNCSCTVKARISEFDISGTDQTSLVSDESHLYLIRVEIH
jgi:hypothetical protein